jgi:hypothetical protein
MEAQVVDLLGGSQVLGGSLKSNLVRATREGLPAETAVRLAELISGIDVVATRRTDPTGRLSRNSRM